MAPFPCIRESFLVFLEAARPLGDGFLEDLATVQRTAYRWKDLEACEGKKQTLQSFLDCIEIARTCLLLPDSKWKQYFDGRPLPKSPPVGFVPCQTSCSSSTDGYESFEDRVRRRYDHPIDLYIKWWHWWPFWAKMCFRTLALLPFVAGSKPSCKMALCFWMVSTTSKADLEL